MMADYWVLPLAPLRLSVILLDKAVPQALRVTSGGKIGTTHNVGSSLRVWLVTVPDQHLTKTMLGRVCPGLCYWVGS